MAAVATQADQEHAARVAALAEQVAALEDPAARELAEELAAGLVELYGEGLRRVVELVDDAARAALADDGVVASLLLLHDLYPVALGQRVEEALEEVRPYLASHDGGVELVSLQDGVLRLRLTGSCDGCAASAATLQAAVSEALLRAAPDLLGLEVAGAVAPRSRAEAEADPEVVWMELGDAALIGRGVLTAAPPDLVVANVAGTLLAYRDRCAACARTLADGMLLGGTLTCAGCAASFDLPRAGRSRDDRALQLDPVPLLRGRDGVRVAVPRAGVAPLLPEAPKETGHCEICPSGLSDAHRHLLDLEERRIVCVCETCWSLRSGDARYRPTGQRTLELPDFVLDDELWGAFQIPIGLAFLLRSGSTGELVALYPSSVGATEHPVDEAAWARLCAVNPVLEHLQPDGEALLVNRLPGTGAPCVLIAPIDDCYRLVGLIKSRWEGISGGRAVESAVLDFLAGLRGEAAAA